MIGGKMMVFENSGIENVVIPQGSLQEIMNHNGCVLGGSWDYERMTFDYKYEIPEGIYYLRFPGYAVDGDVVIIASPYATECIRRHLGAGLLFVRTVSALNLHDVATWRNASA